MVKEEDVKTFIHFLLSTVDIFAIVGKYSLRNCNCLRIRLRLGAFIIAQHGFVSKYDTFFVLAAVISYYAIKLFPDSDTAPDSVLPDEL